ncbi:pectinesterase family protein [uncultured Alistipes sp.]|jgi:pectinesterase|uniref:pectinesterase family protein n=1 Tax=uncultured Alistipes sp. TaxID=538949 RepID=UPI0025F85045|nr:pectinesterase family protein [uncultured Alistipes sp.]
MLRLLAICVLGLAGTLSGMAQTGAWCSDALVRIHVVDCNGGGEFTTIQACFDALPSKPETWRIVRIMPGTYREKLTLDVYKDKVMIVGQGERAEDVRIVWDDYSGKIVDGYEMTTYDSYTFSVQADDVELQNLTVANDAGRVGQAVALETRGDRIHIDRCRLEGDQDTFFTKGYVSRVYVSRSYIEGTTDFIFGPSIAVFDKCEIHCKADSFITAASTTERNKYGYVFMHCRVTAADGVSGVYLGRPWKSSARTVWLFCELPAAIRPEGWRDWHDTAQRGTAFYAEYECRGDGADRSGRVAWSHALTDAQAREYTIRQIFTRKTGSEQFRTDWNPFEMKHPLDRRLMY